MFISQNKDFNNLESIFLHKGWYVFQKSDLPTTKSDWVIFTSH